MKAIQRTVAPHLVQVSGSVWQTSGISAVQRCRPSRSAGEFGNGKPDVVGGVKRMVQIATSFQSADQPASLPVRSDEAHQGGLAGQPHELRNGRLNGVLNHAAHDLAAEKLDILLGRGTNVPNADADVVKSRGRGCPLPVDPFNEAKAPMPAP